MHHMTVIDSDNRGNGSENNNLLFSEQISLPLFLFNTINTTFSVKENNGFNINETR